MWDLLFTSGCCTSTLKDGFPKKAAAVWLVISRLVGTNAALQVRLHMHIDQARAKKLQTYIVTVPIQVHMSGLAVVLIPGRERAVVGAAWGRRLGRGLGRPATTQQLPQQLLYVFVEGL